MAIRKFLTGASILLIAAVLVIPSCKGRTAGEPGQDGVEEDMSSGGLSEGKGSSGGEVSKPGDFGYIRNNSADGVIITYYTGSAKSIIIPEKIDDLPVTGFVREFFQNEEYTSVSLPDTIKEIPESAFYYCTALTSVRLPAALETIPNSAFYECVSLNSIVIPASVTKIGRTVFYDCRALKSVDIQGKVTDIGASAFANCRGLVKVTVQEGLTTLGAEAFINCRELSSFNVPASLKTMPSGTFSNCHKLPLAVRDKLKSQGYDGKGF